MAKMFEQNDKSDPKLLAKLLDPELAVSLFSKTNGTKPDMLVKLVEKGKSINPD